MIPLLPPVVVGAGPAGIRAAEALVAAGLRPVVIDEAARAGGQIYRRPPVGFVRSAKTLYGFDHRRAAALHATMERLLPHMDYRPLTTVWNVEPGRLLTTDGRSLSSLPFSRLVIASGATDRVLPVPGWTLPGVFTLGGAQVSLKAQAAAIGRRVVFAGTGPLLYLVAHQYRRAGVEVAAVLDTARLTDKLAALPAMAARPVMLARGLWYMADVRRAGVPIVAAVEDIRIGGEGKVEHLVYRFGGDVRSVACDAVALGFGLRPETQLADLAECRFRFDATDRAWLPIEDGFGRTTTPGVYVAGDGAGIHGAFAAERAGRRAAMALLKDAGRAVSPRRRGFADRVFPKGLARAFPLPKDWGGSAADDLVVCRCEEITAGELRAAVGANGVAEANRVKALTRAGMGRCQGRMCGPAVAEILAAAAACEVAAVGRFRAQPPVKPLPVATLAGAE